MAYRNEEEDNIRARASKFTQFETERLCELILINNGNKTDLSPDISIASVRIQAAEWARIEKEYNKTDGIPHYRNQTQLMNRLKRIKKDICQMHAYECAMASNDGRAKAKNPPKISFAIIGKVAEFKNSLGLTENDLGTFYSVYLPPPSTSSSPPPSPSPSPSSPSSSTPPSSPQPPQSPLLTAVPYPPPSPTPSSLSSSSASAHENDTKQFQSELKQQPQQQQQQQKKHQNRFNGYTESENIERQRYYKARTLLVNEQRKREQDFYERRVRAFEASHAMEMKFWIHAIQRLAQHKSSDTGDTVKLINGQIRPTIRVRNDLAKRPRK